MLVEHHTKYQELHGEDKTVWMTQSDHLKLHNRLRSEGQCNVPVDELHKISLRAHQRTEKSLKYHRRHKKEYRKQNMQFLDFIETVGINAQLVERIEYNHKTGFVSYTARFRGNRSLKLPVVEWRP